MKHENEKKEHLVQELLETEAKWIALDEKKQEIMSSLTAEQREDIEILDIEISDLQEHQDNLFHNFLKLCGNNFNDAAQLLSRTERRIRAATA